ncbi:MAG: NAD(P)H-dependent oxidoreductase [Candidatus Methanomethylophilaceae archaeon]|nr:NAD(P)H-dependent oxidoreductase [Candidatus Methanomethylophilaceae archaeon]
MVRLLFVNGCVDRGRSRTLRLAKELISRIEADEVDEMVLEEADLAPLDTTRLKRRESLALAGELEDPEFSVARRYASADILVVATPFWEFGFNSMTKIFLENVSQIGISFAYTDEGVPQGLTSIGRAYYVTTRGGFTDDAHDLGFMMFKEIATMHGIGDVRIISANALDIVGNDPEAIIDDAISRIDRILRGRRRKPGSRRPPAGGSCEADGSDWWLHRDRQQRPRSGRIRLLEEGRTRQARIASGFSAAPARRRSPATL